MGEKLQNKLIFNNFKISTTIEPFKISRWFFLAIWSQDLVYSLKNSENINNYSKYFVAKVKSSWIKNCFKCVI